MGLLLAREEPCWVGHLLWAGILIVAFTFLPAAKWFGTYQVCAKVNIHIYSAKDIQIHMYMRQPPLRAWHVFGLL